MVQNVNEYLIRELQSCKDAMCIMTYLLAIRNIGLPQNIPLLLEYIKSGGIVGLVAMEALKDVGEQHFNKEVCENNLLHFSQIIIILKALFIRVSLFLLIIYYHCNKHQLDNISLYNLLLYFIYLFIYFVYIVIAFISI